MTNHEDVDPDAGEGVRITDKRKIDPETGQARAAAPAQGTAPAGDPGPAPTGADSDTQVAELTADLQRVTAEYANYRKRVDRDREAVTDLAAAAVVTELLPVLDDLSRAKEHGEFEGALKSIGDALEAIVGRLGLEQYGEVGDEFDPTIHEAMTHSTGADLPAPRVDHVFAVGYRFRGRELRPARVGVEE